jgi:predicted anti-sigma-YlaC factor YlaD
MATATGSARYSRSVRRLLLTVGMLLMGMALVGGAAVSLVGTSLVPLDQEVGTHASAAGAVLGIGLMAAAFNPSGNIGWVRAGILYGFVVLAFEAGSYYLWHAPFHIGPVFFGLAFSLLLIATYPERRQLVPPAPNRKSSAARDMGPPVAKAAPPIDAKSAGGDTEVAKKDED